MTIEDIVVAEVRDVLQSVQDSELDVQDALDWIMGNMKDVAIGKGVKVETVMRKAP